MGMFVGDLIAPAENAMEVGLYAVPTRRAYRGVWRKFECFCLTEGCGEPTREDGWLFVALIGCPAADGMFTSGCSSFTVDGTSRVRWRSR
jgi:hypothetical protein